jgi:hypothetical protein
MSTGTTMSGSLFDQRNGTLRVRKVDDDGGNTSERGRQLKTTIPDERIRRQGSRSSPFRPAVLRCCLAPFAAAVVVVLFIKHRGIYTLVKTSHSSIDHGNYAASQQSTDLSRRFPEFGSAAFCKKCPWAGKPLIEGRNCTLFFSPRANDHEGLAQWVTMTVQGYMQAQLTGCRLLLDYTESVDLRQALIAPSLNGQRSMDWTVPTGFVCYPDKHCRNVPVKESLNSDSMGPQRLNVPSYRHVYKNITKRNLHRSNFRHLEQGLPGFQLEHGFACSFGSMFQLAPTAAQFEPELFTQLLPTLRDPVTLVLAVYVRTGYTDVAARVEANRTRINDANLFVSTHYHGHKASATCALQLEQDYLKGRKGDFHFSRIVWILISDSTHVKHNVAETYGSKEVHANNKTVMRTVLKTGSHGRHSRPERNPSTADFAESLIDWYLIGESDAVITNNKGYTFVTTAGMRSNRPIYDGGNGCSLMTYSLGDAT